jgi:hypothetical protein
MNFLKYNSAQKLYIGNLFILQLGSRDVLKISIQKNYNLNFVLKQTRSKIDINLLRGFEKLDRFPILRF